MKSNVLSIWQLAAMQLLKDCGKEIQSDIIEQIRDKEDLMALALNVITALLKSGSHALTSALYRLDIPEKKIKQQTLSLSPNERLITVAKAAIERCIQKVEIRRRYSSRENNE